MNTETKSEDPRVERREALLAGLPGFTGTENWYRHLLNINYTDGINFVAETAGAYWLIDIIASYQPELRKKVSAFTGEKGIPYQVWRLVVNLQDNTAVVTCHEDWSEENPLEYPAIIRQEISYTDFPLTDFSCYCEGNVILLRSEH